MKGPVPSAALLRSPCFLIPASLMMKPQKPPRAASSPANGSLVTNFTAYLPAGSTLSTAMKSDLPRRLLEEAVEGELHVGGGQLLAVVELHALAELERPGEAVLARSPTTRPARASGSCRVEAHELVVHQGRAPAARERGDELGIEAGGLGGLGGDQGAARLRASARRRGGRPRGRRAARPPALRSWRRVSGAGSRPGRSSWSFSSWISGRWGRGCRAGRRPAG